MGYTVLTGDVSDVVPPLADAWDGLPAQRGLQADVLDSYAWLAAWLRSVPGERRSLRLPMVLDGDRPLGLLPLVARSPRRWESAGRPHRPRYRPVLAQEAPDEEVLGLLVDAVGGAGVRELALHRLPGRDPAVAALLALLQKGGFQVARRARGREYLAAVTGGWADHRRRFASYDRRARSSLNAARQLWDVRLDELPVAEGFPLLVDVYRQSWKGLPPPAHTRYLRALMERAEQLGWCRLFVLRVAGRPAAVDVWYRLGGVAIATSTAYDRRLAALRPGAVAGWLAQERLLAERHPPRLLDLLPGPNPRKETLGPEGGPVLDVEAARRTLVTGVTLAWRHGRGRAGRAALDRLGALLRRAGALPALQRPARGRAVLAAPTAAGTAPLPAAPVEPAGWLCRYLAVATARPNTEAVAATASAGTWWRVGGERPVALAHLALPGGGQPGVVRELVLIDHAAQPEQVLAALAAAAGTPVRAYLPAPGQGRSPLPRRLAPAPIPVHLAALPWPGRPTPPPPQST